MASIEYVKLDNWKNRWDKGITSWHIDFVDKCLQKYIELLTDGNSELSILVPLCGKSLDLKWLIDKGHKVFGVEISDLAVRQIFKEADLSPKLIPVDSNSTLYEACDGRLKVLVGDMFSLQSDLCGQFDCIWDKSSFGAINPVDRERYANLIHSLLKPQGKILMCAYDFNQSERNPPPFAISTDTLNSHFGEKFDIEFLESTEDADTREKHKLSSFNRQFHLMRKLN